MKEDHAVEGVLNHMEENALIVKKQQKEQIQQHTSFSILCLLQEKRPSNQMVLVEAKCKMSRMRLIRTHGKGMQFPR